VGIVVIVCKCVLRDVTGVQSRLSEPSLCVMTWGDGSGGGQVFKGLWLLV